jgi:hypothetical protein
MAPRRSKRTGDGLIKAMLAASTFVTFLASAVLAHAVNYGFASDTAVGFSSGSSAQQRRIAVHKSSHYYAVVPGDLSNSNPNSAAETGGGSLGYNETLLRE